MDKWTRFLRAALGYTMTVTYAVDLLPGTCFTVEQQQCNTPFYCTVAPCQSVYYYFALCLFLAFFLLIVEGWKGLHNMVRDLSVTASMESRDLNRPFVQPDDSNEDRTR